MDDTASTFSMSQVASTIPLCQTFLASSRSHDSAVRLPCPHSPTRSFKNERTLALHLRKKHDSEPIVVSSDSPTTSRVGIASPSPESVLNELIAMKSNVRTLRRIPKGARFTAADKLSRIIENYLQRKDLSTFKDLLFFAYCSFNVSNQSSGNTSLTKKVKDNIISQSHQIQTDSARVRSRDGNKDITKVIEYKVGDFDIKGAVKLLSSDDTLALFNNETYEELKSKHPSPSRVLIFPDSPDDSYHPLVVNQSDILKAINSFPAGSAPGFDGMRPQFLKDMVSKSAGEAGSRALGSITKLCNFLLTGQMPETFCSIFYGASLCALRKKDGGLRPIAIGNCFRRLTAKVACFQIRQYLNEYLLPHQVGVSAKLGSESAIHAARTYIENPQNMSKVLLKIDFANAFNSIERDSMLEQISNNFPMMYPFLYQCYREPSHLIFGDKLISSKVGVQQGDPCGSMAFSVTVHPIVKEMMSEFNIWYLDDVTLADKPEVVLQDLEKLINLSQGLGLKINPAKCELYFCSDNVDETILDQFRQLADKIQTVHKEDLNLLGAPLSLGAFRPLVNKKIKQVENLRNKSTQLNAHVAYTLIKNCLFVPKFNFLLRTCPFWKFPDVCNQLDTMMKSTLEKTFNLKMNESQWYQACLPVNRGGLGIRKIQDICLPSFLASVHAVQDLVSQLTFTLDTSLNIHLFQEATDCWNNIYSSQPLEKKVQKMWDIIVITEVEHKIQPTITVDVARLKALKLKESNSWLHAIPSKNIGTSLDSKSFSICIGLRLGCNIVAKHKCVCGDIVDESGIHGLSCSKSAGRIPRHNSLNAIIHRALTAIHMHPILEPVGISRNDGKRPDGATLVAWSKGQKLLWDATCVDTLALSYVNRTSQKGGAAAEIACHKKHNKYSNLTDYDFKALAVETYGPFCEEMKNFIEELGNALIVETGESRAKMYLYQRISLEVQRGNAACIEGTMPYKPDLYELYNL